LNIARPFDVGFRIGLDGTAGCQTAGIFSWQLATNNFDIPWRFDANSDRVALDFQDFDLDVVTDDDVLILLP
jgi:hypothetical protein